MAASIAGEIQEQQENAHLRPASPPLDYIPANNSSTRDMQSSMSFNGQKKVLSYDDSHSPVRPSTPEGQDQPSDKDVTGRNMNYAQTFDTSGFEPIVDDYKPNAALDLYMKFTLLCLRLVSSKIFQNFITLVIIGASVMVGMQTYPALENEPTLNTADSIVLAIFTVECALKVLAVGLRPWEYLFDQDGINFWNVFDFVVVVVCYLPLDASMVTVIRLFRLLRVLKLVRTLPELQILVMGLIGSIPSIFYVALLLCLVFYLFGIMCLSFFKENDPVNFADLQTTFLTLFRMSTLDDWVDIMYTAMYGNDIYPCDPWRDSQCTTPKSQPLLASLFFVSFTVLSAFVVLNLFIGVVATQMDEAKSRLQKENDSRGNMAGCEDEFDEEERMAKLIFLRFDDLSQECASILSEVHSVNSSLDKIQKQREARSAMFASLRSPVKSRGRSAGGAKSTGNGDESADGTRSARHSIDASTLNRPSMFELIGEPDPSESEEPVSLPWNDPAAPRAASVSSACQSPSTFAVGGSSFGRNRLSAGNPINHTQVPQHEQAYVDEVKQLQAELRQLQDAVPDPDEVRLAGNIPNSVVDVDVAGQHQQQ